MAFLPQTDQDQKNQGTTQQQIPLIPTLAGSGGPSSGGQAGAQGVTNTASPGAAPTQPWSNISSYLSANAPQSKQVADTLAGNLSQNYADIQNQAKTAGENFTNQVNQNTVGLDKNLFNQATANPTEFAKSPENVAAFQKAYNANYAGPSKFEETPDYANLMGKIQTGQQNANLLNQGTSGIESFLQNTQKNATPGMNALDTLLLQETPENFTTVSKAASPYAGLSDFLTNQTSTLNKAAQEAQAATGQTANTFQNAFAGEKGIVPTWQSGLDARLAAAQKQAADNATKYQSDISGKNPAIGQQEANALGLDPAEWAQMVQEAQALGKTYQPPSAATTEDSALGVLAGLESQYGQNFDFSKYMTANDPNAAINRSNFATPDDYAEAAALAQLTGQPAYLNPTDAKLAGTYNPNLVSFNQKAASQDVAKQLAGNDQQVLNQTPVGIASQDPNAIAFLKDVYSRNVNALNQNQKGWFDRIGGTPTTPATPPTVTPSAGDTRLNSTSGQMEYFNNGQWIAAPKEYTQDPNTGGWQHFNYQTGQYAPSQPPPTYGFGGNKYGAV